MLVYKLCDCGHKNIFDDSKMAPKHCEKCPRSIFEKPIFSMDHVIEEDENNYENENVVNCNFMLVNEQRGICICLPEDEEFIIGREGIGAEHFTNTISRKHLYVKPRGRLGYTIIDKGSLNGTAVNGEKIELNIEKLIVNGDTLTLDINESGISFKLKKTSANGGEQDE